MNSVRLSHLLVLTISIASLAGAIWAVVSVLRTPNMRATDTFAWVVVGVFLPIIGALAWLIERGRRRRSFAAAA